MKAAPPGEGRCSFRAQCGRNDDLGLFTTSSPAEIQNSLTLLTAAAQGAD